MSSTGRGVGGVAIMIHTSLCPSLPNMKEYVHGHLMSVALPIRPDPLIGLLRFAGYYGPHDKRIRATCIPHLHQRSRQGALVSGDYNTTMGASNASTLNSNIWLSKTFLSFFRPSSAKVCNFSGVPGAQDHDPVVVTLQRWSTIEVAPPRCGMWNQRHLKRYRQLMDEATPLLPSMHAYSDVEPCYEALGEKCSIQ